MCACLQGLARAGLVGYSVRMTDLPRHFLFLQGPHGPFFRGLARNLMTAGASVSRIGFTAGDQLFWSGLPGYRAFHGTTEAWADTIHARLDAGVTDLVCYGTSRPIHAEAIAQAKSKGVRVHAFEEGYLRPYWITYERGGTNAESPLHAITIEEMTAAVGDGLRLLDRGRDAWGDMRQHVFWGAVYHASLLAGRRNYPAYRSHRELGAESELPIYLRHLIAMPKRRIVRRIAMARLKRATFPYHVILCQLAHDANFRDNTPFGSQREFLETIFAGFAIGSRPHHHLIVKAHPLEDGRENLSGLVKELSRAHGISERVHLVTGGKLAPLLDRARSVVTANSTGAEQALWRGLPLKAFGAATYHRPEFVSRQSLAQFFAEPTGPDGTAYQNYRQFLLETSQISGGFYSASGRRKLLRVLPDLMLAEHSPYEKRLNAPASGQQHIRIVT